MHVSMHVSMHDSMHADAFDLWAGESAPSFAGVGFSPALTCVLCVTCGLSLADWHSAVNPDEGTVGKARCWAS
jgi:hypothetical protein